MAQTSGSGWIFWSQLLYSLPFILVSIAAVIVCVMNWQKAPTAAMFCLIGFGLIGFNSIFGAFITAMMIRNAGNTGLLREVWSIVSAVRIIFNVAGYVFLLIAVFSGRNHPATPPSSSSSAPTQPRNPQ
jgi:hypothetical protein